MIICISFSGTTPFTTLHSYTMWQVDGRISYVTVHCEHVSKETCRVVSTKISMFTNSDHSKCTLISESNWIAKLLYAHWIFWLVIVDFLSGDQLIKLPESLANFHVLQICKHCSEFRHIEQNHVFFIADLSEAHYPVHLQRVMNSFMLHLKTHIYHTIFVK